MLKTRYQDQLTEAGCDEAGRGSFAGPVFAAAVILPPSFSHPQLNDSKQLSEKTRYEMREIIEKEATSFCVSYITHTEIDRINILKASIKAMHRALAGLSIQPGLILIDGNRFYKYKRIPYRCIVKGDELFTSIAAASVLAKTYRDDFMKKLHTEFPCYNWFNNKGYGTEEHRKAIDIHGVCKYHRKSFNVQNMDPVLFPPDD